MPVSEATYRRLALEDDTEKWELFRGQLRKKPVTTYDHNHIARLLAVDQSPQEVIERVIYRGLRR